MHLHKDNAGLEEAYQDKIQYERVRIEEENAIVINTLKMELQNAKSDLKAAVDQHRKDIATASVAVSAAGAGPTNGILNNLPPAESGPTKHSESLLAGAVHFLKNKYDSNNMHIPHQNDDILGPSDGVDKKGIVDCRHTALQEPSFYEIFGYLTCMGAIFLSIITAISLFGRWYGGKQNTGIVDGLCYVTSSSSGHILSGRAGYGNHKKDNAHVV